MLGWLRLNWVLIANAGRTPLLESSNACMLFLSEAVQALRIENYIKPVTSFHHAMEEKTIKTDDLAKLILDEFTASSREEELAFFMEKFNLNLDTLEIMPALKEHLEELMSEE